MLITLNSPTLKRGAICNESIDQTDSPKGSFGHRFPNGKPCEGFGLLTDEPCKVLNAYTFLDFLTAIS